jgi:formylglycine-generating enzyme required for sulfatase activity
MPHIFISYAKKDSRLLAENLFTTINEMEGFSAWMDESLEAAESWALQIQAEIDRADLVIVLLSPDVNRSPSQGQRRSFVLNEIDYAQQDNKPILPIMARQTKMPVQIAGVQYIDFTEDARKGLERLFRLLQSMNSKPITLEAAANTPKEGAKPALQKDIQLGKSIILASALMEKEDYEEAIALLESIHPLAKNNDQMLIGEMLQEARIGSRYQQIAALAKVSRMQGRACQEYQAFRREHPTFPDEKGLKAICKPLLPKTKDILPAPFDWCEIPRGIISFNAVVGVTQVLVPAFLMAKYPVTNAQYAKFIEAGGYQNKAWWADSWQIKEDGWHQDADNLEWKPSGKAWTEPRYWMDKDYLGDDKPVVGVSWYEAIAFCQWLSETSGENINLPTEQQWQRAAQGDDGRKYPWGNDFDAKKANSYDSGIAKTTPVTAYPNGVSPYGVWDMSGNVWEWCLNQYKTGIDVLDGKDDYAFRGASWISDDTELRTDHRSWIKSYSRGHVIGFRICSASTSL